MGMWESRRDFQRVWEGWEAGLMAFHAFHTLSFPWPALEVGSGFEIAEIPVLLQVGRGRQSATAQECLQRLQEGDCTSKAHLASHRETWLRTVAGGGFRPDSSVL